jgi:hypothetical protein
MHLRSLAYNRGVGVFISYAARDAKWASEFWTHLKALGVEAWFDRAELLPGDNYHTELGRALESSDALLVLVSPASAVSESVRREVQFALGSERFENRVIPVIVEPAKRMPWILSSFQAVSGGPAEAAQQVAHILAAPTPQGSSSFATSG